MSTPAAIRVDAARDKAFRLTRHGLAQHRVANQPVEALAAMLFGLHAARLSSPWVALRVRSSAFEPAELRRLLVADRTLIKVRCMRQTLHILPLHLAVTAHHATLRQRLGPCRSRLRNLGRSERALRAVASRLRAEIADMPVPYRVLEAKLAASGHPGDLALARLAIKWLWETGELAHVDLSPSLHHEHRAFALTDARFPGLGLRPQPPDLDAACDELVRHHIRAFGPVSIDDTAWWSGLGRATVRRAVDRHASEFVRVRVAGISEDLLLAGEDANDLVSAKPLDPRQVTLLAHEDPALKGYFSTRTRYVAPDNYNQLFNSIGEARPSIMCGGQVIGIWTFDRRARRVVHTLLRPVPRTARKAIRDLLLDIEGFLRAEPVHGATGVPGAPVGPLG